MKALFASLLIALASTTAPAVAQGAPAPAPAAPKAEAPSPERVELARRFIGLVNPPDKMMEGVSEGMWHSAAAGLSEIEDEAERDAAEQGLEQLMTRMEPKLKELMPGLLEAYSQVYAREFSADELRAMIAFAETPAGKHYLARVDLLDFDPDLVDAQQELMTGLAPVMDDFRKEMCAKRAAQRLAAGDKKATCPLSREPDTLAG